MSCVLYKWSFNDQTLCKQTIFIYKKLHNPFLMKSQVWGINVCGPLTTRCTSVVGFLLFKCVYLSKTEKRIHKRSHFAKHSAQNISILWFFSMAERCLYREKRNPYQYWLPRLITLQAILSLLVMTIKSHANTTEKRSTAYCYQTVKERDRAVASTSDKKNCWGKENTHKMPPIVM